MQARTLRSYKLYLKMMTSTTHSLHETCSDRSQTSRQESDHLHSKVQPNVIVVDVGDLGERSFVQEPSEMGIISIKKLMTLGLGRLFVSAILSLISILISPVLSTDAMWNVITDATGTGLETSMANVARYPHFSSLSTGSA